QMIASFEYTNVLAVGDSLVRTQHVTIPQDARAGNARFAVQLDANDQIDEKNETNNFFTATESLAIQPVLSFNLPVTSISEAAADPHVAALISRNGDLSVPLTVPLTSSDTKEITVPPSVTFRAGDVSVPVVLFV